MECAGSLRVRAMSFTLKLFTLNIKRYDYGKGINLIYNIRVRSDEGNCAKSPESCLQEGEWTTGLSHDFSESAALSSVITLGHSTFEETPKSKYRNTPQMR